MKCFVTGASGFVGANLVHALNAAGHEVRALMRGSSDRRGLAGATYETILGDVCDRDLLRRSMAGCDWCFHVAASYSLWLPEYDSMYAANVEGTECVLTAAAEAGCQRIVYTSTVGCMGVPRPVNGSVTPSDEETPVSEGQMSNHYKRSKWQAEQVALRLAGQGLPVVVVNPTFPVGPRDVKPTPSGCMILQFLNRQMPAFLDTGLNWAPVKDVVAGHILAAEKGCVGERYILGNEGGNWTLETSLGMLSELTGIPAPRFQIPYAVAWTAGQCCELVSRLTRRPPHVPIAGVKMARYKMFFTSAKAIRELGLPQSCPRQAMAESVAWFREHGYVS